MTNTQQVAQERAQLIAAAKAKNAAASEVRRADREGVLGEEWDEPFESDGAFLAAGMDTL